VAATVAKVVSARKPKIRYRTEMDGKMANFFRRTMPQRAFYGVLSRRFDVEAAPNPTSDTGRDNPVAA
jgi:hypothetical protein